MSWKDRVKANEESGENAKVRAEAAGMLSGAMKQHLVTSGEYKDQAQMDQFNRYISEYNDIVQKYYGLSATVQTISSTFVFIALFFLFLRLKKQKNYL